MDPADTLATNAPLPWRHERYVHMGVLGRGSFGDVYLARDSLRGHDVALKLLRRWDPTCLAQLRREFRALKHLEHPNLVELYELHADDRDGFITMEVIVGRSLVEFVRGAVDEAERRFRIRSCLAQLTGAIAALHTQGTLHRDVKPSNALVTSSGRLVVLDAGLAKSIDAQRSSERYICGTPAYMSPEQASGRSLDEASDWYSVGVLAFELHTGRVPFADHELGVLYAKVNTKAPSIADFCPDLPKADVGMIDGLLAADPRRRPGHSQLCEWLHLDPEVAQGGARSSAHRLRTALVGRRAELDHLDRALAAARANGSAIASLKGGSGIGKTSLVRHWLGKLSSNEARVLVGRCYQRETVLFGGFEDMFEAISEHLDDGAPELEPEEVASIELVLGHRLRLGPKLRGVESALTLRAPPPEPSERRRLVGRALSKLLAHVAAELTLVVWLDDLQWGGVEIAALLADIAHARVARGCLLILSHREVGAEDGACLSALCRALEFTHPLELGPLPAADATTLVEDSVAKGNLKPDEVARLVGDAGGNPLLLEQAALHLTLEAPTKCTDLTAILVARIERLQPDERVLLQVLAVAAEPVPELTVLTAAGVKSGSGPVRSLLAANLVRRVGTVGHCLVPFHDQLREVIVARLAPEEARAINVAIADALDTNRQGQPEALVAYYLAGGERHRAAHYVAAAAKRMAQALAFDRAVKLFRISLDLAPELGNEETQRMRVGLADALVNCGRVEEGARQRLEAAARLDSGGERDRLTGQAAAELVRAGRIDEGLQHAQNTFASLGLRLSRSSVGAVASIIADRVRLSIRGLDHQVRPAAAISPKLLKRVDWCQSLAIVLPVVDTLRGFQVHNQGLLWALEAGEPARLGQALAMEAGFQMALAGGRDATGKVRQLLDSARMLADASGDPRARGVVEIVVGSTRWSAGDWSGCVRHTEEGVAMLRRHCAGVFWEVNFGQTHALDALSWMGQLRKKNAILLEELEQARGRGDLYAETMYTLRDLPTLHLIADRGDEAEACAHALESWPNRGFQVEHMANLYKQAEVELYRGEGAAATKRVEAEWDNLARSQLTRLQPFRIELNALRGRAALAAAHSLPTGSARKRLLQLAARVVQSLGREPPSVRGAVFGAPVAAGVAVLRGDREEAARCLEKGVRAASESGMRLYEEALRYQLGRLTGGDEGRKAMSDAETWMRSEGMRRPDRYIPMLCPAIEP